MLKFTNDHPTLTFLCYGIAAGFILASAFLMGYMSYMYLFGHSDDGPILDDNE